MPPTLESIIAELTSILNVIIYPRKPIQKLNSCFRVIYKPRVGFVLIGMQPRWIDPNLRDYLTHKYTPRLTSRQSIPIHISEKHQGEPSCDNDAITLTSWDQLESGISATLKDRLKNMGIISMHHQGKKPYAIIFPEIPIATLNKYFQKTQHRDLFAALVSLEQTLNAQYESILDMIDQIVVSMIQNGILQQKISETTTNIKNLQQALKDETVVPAIPYYIVKYIDDKAQQTFIQYIETAFNLAPKSITMVLPYPTPRVKQFTLFFKDPQSCQQFLHQCTQNAELKPFAEQRLQKLDHFITTFEDSDKHQYLTSFMAYLRERYIASSDSADKPHQIDLAKTLPQLIADLIASHAPVEAENLPKILRLMEPIKTELRQQNGQLIAEVIAKQLQKDVLSRDLITTCLLDPQSFILTKKEVDAIFHRELIKAIRQAFSDPDRVCNVKNCESVYNLFSVTTKIEFADTQSCDYVLDEIAKCLSRQFTAESQDSQQHEKTAIELKKRLVEDPTCHLTQVEECFLRALDYFNQSTTPYPIQPTSQIELKPHGPWNDWNRLFAAAFNETFKNKYCASLQPGEQATTKPSIHYPPLLSLTFFRPPTEPDTEATCYTTGYFLRHPANMEPTRPSFRAKHGKFSTHLL